MKSKTKNILIISIISLILLIGIFAIIIFRTNNSVLNDNKESFNFDYQGITFNGQSNGIGSLSSNYCGSGSTGGTGTHRYSNQYNSNSDITLSSSISSLADVCGGNYIWIESDIPKGNLTISCDSSSFYKRKTSGVSSASCKVYLDNKLVFSSGSGSSGDIYDVSNSKSENQKIEINKTSKLKIILESSASSYGGSSSVSSRIFFNKYIEPAPVNSENEENNNTNNNANDLPVDNPTTIKKTSKNLIILISSIIIVIFIILIIVLSRSKRRK
jgi:hypothetical protein